VRSGAATLSFSRDGSAYAGGVDTDSGRWSGRGTHLQGGAGMPSVVYEGEWLDGEKHGLGIEVSRDSFYAGRFAHGKRCPGPHGQAFPLSSWSHRSSGSASTVASPADLEAPAAPAYANPCAWTHEEALRFAQALHLPDVEEAVRSRRWTGADLWREAGALGGPDRISAVVLARALRVLGTASGVPALYDGPRVDAKAALFYGTFAVAGGNGVVHHAEYNGEPVVVKVPRHGGGSDIVKEALILQALAPHRNLVEYEAFLDDHGPALILGRCDWTLFDALHRSGTVIGMAETADIGAGIAAGLEHLHASGIVHFDVKSPNVLLSFDLQSVRLCDLGHAGYRSARGVFPHPVCGTPVTAAPEVLDAAPASFPADVWSLGVVLLEMAQLELPFEGLTYSQVIAAVVHCERAVRIPDFLPEEFAGLLRSCLQHDPELRPSAASVGASLREWRATAKHEALGALEDFMDAGRTEAAEAEEEGLAPAAPRVQASRTEAAEAQKEGRPAAPRVQEDGCFSFLRTLFTDRSPW